MEVSSSSRALFSGRRRLNHLKGSATRAATADTALYRRNVIKGLGMGAACALTQGFLPGTAMSAAATASSPAGSEASRREALKQFIHGLPKAELHVHLEGTVAPTEALQIAERNGIKPPYNSAEEFEAALGFDSLDSFLKAFSDTISVLTTEEDFHDITLAYLNKCAEQNIVHAEIKFDPQAHLRRGIRFDTFMHGISAAQQTAASTLNVSSGLIMCFQRDATIDSAGEAFRLALPYRPQIVGIGLDNTEVRNFPAKFAELFTRARSAGFKLTAHCDLDQENTLEHIRACIDTLQVDRLDHAYNLLQDKDLSNRVSTLGLCVTACPTTDYRARDQEQDYYFREVSNAIARMLELNIKVTVNTDDPGVMGNRYLNEVMLDMAVYKSLSTADVSTLARNSLENLWVENAVKEQLVKKLEAYLGSA